MTTPDVQAPTYWIVYGFCEGSRHSRHLRATLRANGLAPAKSLKQADVVIAHSGGCFALPDRLSTQLVVLCQPACGYNASGAQLLGRKVLLDITAHRKRHQMSRWIWKTGLNVRYGVTKLRHNHRIIGYAQQYRTALAPVDAARVAVIISQDDPWSRDLPLTEVRRRPDWRFIGLTGAHDDLWTNPQQIVATIRELYEA